MPKKEAVDPIEKARKRLVKAQADLQEAQETRARVKLQGEEAVDRARQHAARRLTRATLAVEKRSSAVDDARQALEQLRRDQLHASQPAASKNGALAQVGGESDGDSA